MYNLKDENFSRYNELLLQSINNIDGNLFKNNIDNKLSLESQIFYFDTIEKIDYVWSVFLEEYDGVVFVDSGWIANECAFRTLRIIQIENELGKIDVCLLKKCIIDKKIPTLVYLNNTTQNGIAYSKMEIDEIYEFCRQQNLFLYVNGDRLANAIAEWEESLFGIQHSCDMLAIGGTRYGIFFGVLCIVTNPELKIKINNILKKTGIVLEDEILIQKQFSILFNNNGYFKAGSNANKFAEQLFNKLQKEKNVKVLSQNTNHVKVILTKEQHALCSSLFLYNKIQDLPNNEIYVEFVTDWETTEDIISKCVEVISMKDSK